MSTSTSYISFLLSNWRFLSFGLLMTFGSSFGQTYFISLFSADIRESFDLSHGDFGTLYAAATLASAATLIWLGRKVDTIDLRAFTLFVTLGLTTACALMAWLPSIVVLGLAIYTLRLFGQGLMGHTSATAMARYFFRSRGTALSIAALGYPIGEGLFPYTAVTLLGYFTTGQTWGIIAIIVAIVITPIAQIFLTGHSARHQKYLELATSRTGSTDSQRSFSRRDVLRDKNFYVILSVILAPSFIITGIFFHQVHLANVKGWELSHFAASFVAFAACQLGSSLFTGPTIDRSNAVRLLPLFLAPMGASLIVLASFDSSITIIVFMCLAGTTSGASTTISGALWAEVYGVSHIGAIKAMATALMVFASACSPAILGWLFDGSIEFSAILYVMAFYIVTASIFARFWFKNGVRQT
jgi:MFS family permease